MSGLAYLLSLRMQPQAPSGKSIDNKPDVNGFRFFMTDLVRSGANQGDHRKVHVATAKVMTFQLKWLWSIYLAPSEDQKHNQIQSFKVILWSQLACATATIGAPRCLSRNCS